MKSSERRLKLMLMIQQKGKRLTVDELAEHFGVSRRTIFRDFNALQEINVPITWDKYSGYGVMPGFKIPPLMFSTQELATIIIGLNFVKSQVDQQMVDDAKGVELKIKNVLPDELKNFMTSLQDNTVVDPYSKFSAEKKKGGNWYLLSSAISQKLRVEFRYKSGKGEVKTRKVDPYILVFYKDHWNMIGFSHLRGDFRNFILENMSEVRILNEEFKRKPKINAEALIFRSEEQTHLIEVLVEETAVRRFEANFVGNKFRKEKEKLKKIRYSFLFENLEFINEWLFQFGEKVQVEGPSKLIELRKEKLKTMMKDLR